MRLGLFRGQDSTILRDCAVPYKGTNTTHTCNYGHSFGQSLCAGSVHVLVCHCGNTVPSPLLIVLLCSISAITSKPSHPYCAAPNLRLFIHVMFVPVCGDTQSTLFYPNIIRTLPTAFPGNSTTSSNVPNVTPGAHSLRGDAGR